LRMAVWTGDARDTRPKADIAKLAVNIHLPPTAGD
jgi:hypothetical protein